MVFLSALLFRAGLRRIAFVQRGDDRNAYRKDQDAGALPQGKAAEELAVIVWIIHEILQEEPPKTPEPAGKEKRCSAAIGSAVYVSVGQVHDSQRHEDLGELNGEHVCTQPG